MVTVAVLVAVWAGLFGVVRVTAAKMRPEPWSVPWFADWFADWVQRSTADHQDPELAAATLESVVAELARSVAPGRRSPLAV